MEQHKVYSYHFIYLSYNFFCSMAYFVIYLHECHMCADAMKSKQIFGYGYHGLRPNGKSPLNVVNLGAVYVQLHR